MQRKAVWLLLCAGLLGLPVVAAPAAETWGGHYRLSWMEGTAAAEQGAPSMQVALHRAPDAELSQQTEARAADLARWTIAPVGGQGGGETLKPFRPEQYRDFAWSSMHAAGEITCLDGGHLFLCRVKPGATVVFGGQGARQETLQARTGLFGIRLHAGGFELTKLDSTP